MIKRITKEQKQILIDNRKIIIDSQHNYTNNELSILYNLHNEIYKTNKIPINCNSCINMVIISLQKALSKVI
jgi:hypothetical protein